MSIPTQWVVAFENIRRGCIFAHAILYSAHGSKHISNESTQWCWTNKRKNTNVFGTKFRSADKNRMVPLSKAFRILQRTILWIALMSCSFHTLSISQKWKMQSVSVVVKQKPNSNFINRTVERLKMQLATANVNHSISQHFRSQLIYKLHQRIQYVWNCWACDSSMINPFKATFSKRILRREYFEFLHICGDTMALIRLLCCNFRNAKADIPFVSLTTAVQYF